MNGLRKSLLATFLFAATFVTVGAKAMEIRQFDKMADADQKEYIVALIQGAEKVLTDGGKADQAAQVRKLFTANDVGDQISIGMTELIRNLGLARAADARRLEKDPNARRLEVEDAMIVTMRKNGIELPSSFLTIASNFKPK